MQIDNALANILVRDFGAARDWYAVLFGRAPDAEPMEGLAEWAFPAGGWLQVARDPEGAGRGSVTLAVSDIGACATGWPPPAMFRNPTSTARPPATRSCATPMAIASSSRRAMMPRAISTFPGVRPRGRPERDQSAQAR